MSMVTIAVHVAILPAVRVGVVIVLTAWGRFASATFRKFNHIAIDLRIGGFFLVLSHSSDGSDGSVARTLASSPLNYWD